MSSPISPLLQPKRSYTPINIPEAQESLRRPSERRVSFPQVQEVWNSRKGDIENIKKGMDDKFIALKSQLSEIQDTVVVKFLEMSDTLGELNADVCVLRQKFFQLDEKINSLIKELDTELNLRGSRSLHRRVNSE